MKKMLTFVLSSMFFLTACAFPHFPRAKVTFKVVDCEGKPIANEPLMLGFSPTDGHYDETNAEGYFTGEGRTESDYIFTIGHKSKKYYETCFQKQIAHWKDYPKDGKWKPWNETIEIVVKERKNPIPMYAVFRRNCCLYVPLQNQWCGYDFEEHDWLPPHGNGKVSDVEICFTSEYYKDNWRRDFLKLRFPYPKAGAYVMKKDNSSALKSVYHADKNQTYQQEFSFYGPVERNINYLIIEYQDRQKNIIPKDEYIIFRTRTKVDKEGNLIEARYGKIYGPIDFFAKETRQYSWEKDTCELQYYLNPNINDTNIECSGESLLRPEKNGIGKWGDTSGLAP